MDQKRKKKKKKRIKLDIEYLPEKLFLIGGIACWIFGAYLLSLIPSVSLDDGVYLAFLGSAGGFLLVYQYQSIKDQGMPLKLLRPSNPVYRYCIYCEEVSQYSTKESRCPKCGVELLIISGKPWVYKLGLIGVLIALFSSYFPMLYIRVSGSLYGVEGSDHWMWMWGLSSTELDPIAYFPNIGMVLSLIMLVVILLMFHMLNNARIGENGLHKKSIKRLIICGLLVIGLPLAWMAFIVFGFAASIEYGTIAIGGIGVFIGGAIPIISLLFYKATQEKSKDQSVQKLSAQFQEIIINTERIELEKLCQALNISKKIFDKHVLDWAVTFDLTIDGEWLLLNKDTVSDFIDALDSQFKTWQESERKREKKI